MLGIEDGAVEPLGGRLGGEDGLLGLLGESIELHRVVSCSLASARVGLVDEVEEARGPPSFASSDRSVGRTTLALTYRSPWPVALKRGMPWPVSRNVRPGWVPAGILSRTRPLSVPTGTSAPRSASSSGQRELALEVGAAAREDRVGHAA